MYDYPFVLVKANGGEIHMSTMAMLDAPPVKTGVVYVDLVQKIILVVKPDRRREQIPITPDLDRRAVCLLN